MTRSRRTYRRPCAPRQRPLHALPPGRSRPAACQLALTREEVQEVQKIPEKFLHEVLNLVGYEGMIVNLLIAPEEALGSSMPILSRSSIIQPLIFSHRSPRLFIHPSFSVHPLLLSTCWMPWRFWAFIDRPCCSSFCPLGSLSSVVKVHFVRCSCVSMRACVLFFDSYVCQWIDARHVFIHMLGLYGTLRFSFIFLEIARGKKCWTRF